MLVTLANKDRLMREPVLRDLRLVIGHYNAIASATDSDSQQQHVANLLTLFFGASAPPLNRCSAEEMAAFLLAIPGVCGLEQAPGKTAGETDWGALYAHLCATFGWEYHYVDGRLKLSQLKEMRGYMDGNPATHLLVAAYLGYENPDKANSPQGFFDKMRAMYRKPRQRQLLPARPDDCR